MLNTILEMEEKIENWWNNTPFWLMENITGYRQDDFSPEDGYQDFIDACDAWWQSLSDEGKEAVFNDYN